MSTVSTVLKAKREVVLMRSPARALIESMIRYDFKIGDQRQTSMQLCFAYLATWPLYVFALLLAFDPFKNTPLLSGLLSEQNPLILSLFDGRTLAMLICFFVFYVIEWLLRSEQILIAVLMYLVGRGDVHINLVISAVLGIYLARICYQWWAVSDLSDRNKHIWNRLGQIQIFCWIVLVGVALVSLDYLQANYLFQKEGLLTRVNYIAVLIAVFSGMNLALSGLWGHFYFNRPVEPSTLLIGFSTSRWILRFKLKSSFVRELKQTAEQQMQKRQNQLDDFKALMQSDDYKALAANGLKPSLLPLEGAMQSELANLKEALQRISQI